MKKRITITLEPETIESIKMIADQERRSISNLVEVLVNEQIRKFLNNLKGDKPCKK